MILLQRYRICIISLTLACLISGLVIQPSVNAFSLRGLRSKLLNTSKNIRSVQAKLRQTKKQQTTAAQQLAASERKLQVTQASLTDIQSQLKTTKKKLGHAQVKLKQTENKLNKRSELLSDRLVDNYKHGTISYLGVVIGADNFGDFLSRSYLVKKIVQTDAELIRDIREDKRIIELNKDILSNQAIKRAQLAERQRNFTRIVYTQKAERGAILRGIESQRAQYESMLAELAKDSKSIEAMIRSMERTPSGSKRLTQVWRGSFMKPVSGSISCPFGMRIHPILKVRKMHTGVDIAAPYGSSIHAAGNGAVIYSGWYGAYGNTIIIDHGGGMTTLYGHCSRLLVSSGTSVKRGQIIAKVGSTGWSTGNHCHFEVRKHGSPVNPL